LKAMWLSVWKPTLAATFDEATNHRFQVGTRIGEYARQRFSNGILVSEDHMHLKDAIVSTVGHAVGDAPAIFEATVEHARVLCRADVLSRVSRDSWDMIEVKMSTQVKEEHIPDISIQYFCFSRAGYEIEKCHLMHVDKTYVRSGKIDPARLLIAEDVTARVQEHVSTIEDRIKQFVDTLDSPACPEISPGDYCDQPFRCAFYDHCNAPRAAYSIYELSRATKAIATLEALKIEFLRDIPSDFPLTARQKTIVDASKTDKPIIDRAEIANFLGTLSYPLYYFDFETINPAIPLFDKTRPYQTIPFQFSLHVQNKLGGGCVHHDFLLEERQDPREKLIQEMLRLLGTCGSIVAYNMTFEIQCIKGLADSFPEYADGLLSLIPRFRDLIVPFKKGYYVHRDFHGSASLKDILPVVVPSLSYKKLEIQEGETASLKYEQWISSLMEPPVWEKTRSDLLRYCEVDTLGMVEIMRVLMKVGSHT
jgi:Domain of unknown function(DUF2779)